MKNPSEESTPEAGDDFIGRKLIRPSLSSQNRTAPANGESRPDRSARGAKAPTTPDQTHAETFYYQKQIQSRTTVTILLRTGESVEGILEWYDRDSIRLMRRDSSNLLIYKSAIKYMYKTSEGVKK